MLPRAKRRLVDAFASFFNSHQTRILFGACSFLATFAIALGIGLYWLRNDADSSIRVLGSGSSLSLLVTSGDTRMLIASGDDATAFGNALARARHVVSRRIDVVVLAGDDSSIAVAKKARDLAGDDRVFSIDGPLVAELNELGLSEGQVIADAVTFELGDRMTVTVAANTGRDGGWSAVIERGSTRVFAGSDPAGIEGAGVFSAAVITEDTKAGPDLLTATGAVIAMRGVIEAGDAFGDERYFAIVEPGAVARLELIDGGVRLPGSTTAV